MMSMLTLCNPMPVVLHVFRLGVFRKSGLMISMTGSGTLKNLEIKSPCFGGAARRATAIRQIRAEKENVLLLDAGDQSQG